MAKAWRVQSTASAAGFRQSNRRMQACWPSRDRHSSGERVAWNTANVIPRVTDVLCCFLRERSKRSWRFTAISVSDASPRPSALVETSYSILLELTRRLDERPADGTASWRSQPKVVELGYTLPLMPLPAGKVPPDVLRGLLASITSIDPSVIVGPQIGEDAAILDLGGPELVAAKTDPITFATEDIGRYLLAVNGNDLATMGAEPRWLMVTALLPEGIAQQRVESIFQSVREACEEAGVALAGGHTEITVGLDRPILVGFLLGTVERGRVVRTGGARVGDVLVLAGGIAIEGTAILAREHSQELLARGVDRAVIETAAAWLQEPGISVLRMARALNATGAVHAMHDPTEGGLVTALHELSEAAAVGLCVDRSAIPVLPACRVICEALELEPLGLLASGALLAAVAPAEAAAAIDRLHGSGVIAAAIGEIVPLARGRTLIDRGASTALPVLDRDELARYLEGHGRLQPAGEAHARPER